MKKVNGIKLKGNYGGKSNNSKKIIHPVGKDIEDGLPRYDKPGFRAIETPDSTGMIKSYRGAKLFEDGIVRYPSNVPVDRTQAAKVQAYFDYNNSTGNKPIHRDDMYKIYGEDYIKEFNRLSTAKNGPSAYKQDI